MPDLEIAEINNEINRLRKSILRAERKASHQGLNALQCFALRDAKGRLKDLTERRRELARAAASEDIQLDQLTLFDKVAAREKKR